MSHTRRPGRPVLIISALVLVAAAASFVATGATQASQHSVSIAHEIVAPGANVAVSLDATAPPQRIGAVDIAVTFDTAVVEATACTPNPIWDYRKCTIDADAGIVNVTGADVDGLGDGSLATITFLAVGPEATSSPLAIQVAVFALPNETEVQDTLDVTDGSITIVDNPPTPPATQPGDCTGDGDIANIVDVLRLLRHIRDVAVPLSCKTGDCTGDGGAANIVDVLRLLRHTGEPTVPLSC